MPPFTYNYTPTDLTNTITSLMLGGGQQAAQALIQAGQAQAQGIQGAGNAWQQGFNKLGQLPQQYLQLQQLQQQRLAQQQAANAAVLAGYPSLISPSTGNVGSVLNTLPAYNSVYQDLGLANPTGNLGTTINTMPDFSSLGIF